MVGKLQPIVNEPERIGKMEIAGKDRKFFAEVPTVLYHFRPFRTIIPERPSCWTLSDLHA